MVPQLMVTSWPHILPSSPPDSISGHLVTKHLTFESSRLDTGSPRDHTSYFRVLPTRYRVTSCPHILLSSPPDSIPGHLVTTHLTFESSRLDTGSPRDQLN